MDDDTRRKFREIIRKKFINKNEKKKINFVCRNCDNDKYSAFFAPESYADFMLTPIGPSGKTKRQVLFFYCKQCTAVFMDPEK
ncbi:MAG: hypothetical protein Q8O21_00250, partial [bacterium]|nr:hypothetical protein [bacterium]